MNKLVVQNLAKRFDSRRVFKDISFELTSGESIAITGPNGSGKSTLVLCLLAQYHPNNGKVSYLYDEKKLSEIEIQQNSGLVSPYLNLYGQLTAEENIKFFTSIRGNNITGSEINNLLKKVGLEGRGNDNVAGYSSGMSQRLKYAVALASKPKFLFLDEPTSNLDDQGKEAIASIIEEVRQNTILIIATNEKEEYSLATHKCQLGN